MLKDHCIEMAREALLNYDDREEHLQYRYETNIIGLIADLLHLAEAEGVDPLLVIRKAVGHWEVERSIDQ